VEADVHVCVKIARALGLEHGLLLSTTRQGPSAHGRVTSAFACVRRPSCGNDAFFRMRLHYARFVIHDNYHRIINRMYMYI